MAKTVALSCNNCGAGLALSEDVRFVTCNHCGARLEIERTDDATFTKVLEQVSKVAGVADAAAADIEILKLERELERIDTLRAELTNPGTFRGIWILGGIAALGALAMFSSNPEIRAVGILDMLFMGGFAWWLGSGLRGRMHHYEAAKRTLQVEAEACTTRLAAARVRTATPASLLPE